jgi:lipopolysaccharide biosynthesis glycosyltransferase
MSADPLHIVLASDANYAMPLTVVLCSAALNCDKRRSLTFHIMQRGIHASLRRHIEDSVKKARADANIVWLDIPLEKFKDFTITHSYLTAAIYARLMVQWVIPADIDKVLYLDSDLVVLDDLGELWDTDMQGKTVLAAQDRIGYIGASDGLANYRELGIPGANKYFNSGVLLIDLKKWRALDRSAQAFRYLNDHRAIIKMEDQEALNAILFDDWCELEFRWNWQIEWKPYRLGLQKGTPIEAGQRKSLIHFTSQEKPWLPGCEYEEQEYFFQYLNHTHWAGWTVPWSHKVRAYCRNMVESTRRMVSAQVLARLGYR